MIPIYSTIVYRLFPKEHYCALTDGDKYRLYGRGSTTGKRLVSEVPRDFLGRLEIPYEMHPADSAHSYARRQLYTAWPYATKLGNSELRMLLHSCPGKNKGSGVVTSFLCHNCFAPWPTWCNKPSAIDIHTMSCWSCDYTYYPVDI